MFNIKTLLSVFNEKGTLLKWLQKVEEALKNDTLSGVTITQPTDTTAILTFTFKDGSTLESDTINLPRGLQGIPGTNGTNGENGKDGIDGAPGSKIIAVDTQGSREVDGYTETEIDVVTDDSEQPFTFTVKAKNGENGKDGTPGQPGNATAFVLTSILAGLTASGESQTIQTNISSGVGTPEVGQSLEIYSYINNDLYRFMGIITAITDMGAQTVLTIQTVAGSNLKINELRENKKLYKHNIVMYKISDPTQYICFEIICERLMEFSTSTDIKPYLPTNDNNNYFHGIPAFGHSNPAPTVNLALIAIANLNETQFAGRIRASNGGDSRGDYNWSEYAISDIVTEV